MLVFCPMCQNPLIIIQDPQGIPTPVHETAARITAESVTRRRKDATFDDEPQQALNRLAEDPEAYRP